MKTVNPKTIVAKIGEFWSPRVVGEVNDAYIKVARLKGQLAWHKHDDEDELFLILKGRLKIELEDRAAVEIGEGEFFIVPKGLLHNPVAEDECHVLLVESKSTKHTGDAVTEMTRTIAEQLKPL
jgi:mannose-6-phosphate isomerase-like protein (cupin superfamily)